MFFSFQDTIEETECISHIFIVLSKTAYLFCGKIACQLNFFAVVVDRNYAVFLVHRKKLYMMGYK